MPEETQQEILRTLGRLEGTLSVIQTVLADSIDRQTTRLNDHAHRLRRVELWQRWLAGAITIIATLMTTALSVVFERVHRLF